MLPAPEKNRHATLTAYGNDQRGNYGSYRTRTYDPLIKSQLLYQLS